MTDLQGGKHKFLKEKDQLQHDNHKFFNFCMFKTFYKTVKELD